MNDIIDLYEPNRRDAAKLLVDLPKWLHKGTFAKVDPSIGIVGDSALDWPTASSAISQAGGLWILDDLLVEVSCVGSWLLVSHQADTICTEHPVNRISLT